MKKSIVFLMMMAVVVMTACEKEIGNESQPTGQKVYSLHFWGDWQYSTMRGALADDTQMTDLWIFDFVGDECLQTIHQTKTDYNWGTPSVSLSYGTHHLYCVASRGTDPTVNETAKTIVWSKPSDTFWSDYELEVSSGSNTACNITMSRVVTRLRVTVMDEVPADIASLVITPATWYAGLNYTTGSPAGLLSSVDRSVNVPSSYVGTTAQLTMSIFGFSAAEEWTTDVTVTAKNAGGGAIGTATITAAPLRRNRTTDFSGPLFAGGGALTILLDGDWLTFYEGTW